MADDKRTLKWCATHSQPAWLYNDGIVQCMHDLIVEQSSDEHRLVSLRSKEARRG